MMGSIVKPYSEETGKKKWDWRGNGYSQDSDDNASAHSGFSSKSQTSARSAPKCKGRSVNSSQCKPDFTVKNNCWNRNSGQYEESSEQTHSDKGQGKHYARNYTTPSEDQAPPEPYNHSQPSLWSQQTDEESDASWAKEGGYYSSEQASHSDQDWSVHSPKGSKKGRMDLRTIQEGSSSSDQKAGK